eukprot:TRINITY_DN78_c1_g1_i1.p2 TRINITY_DN78_c1_g1~~TRINITY_DN78_c1_g1_i1.p2  ORF type:complete len:457 (+),score=110.75 TRINITY_DN78_c1_g1_i1:11636-13006(+)
MLATVAKCRKDLISKQSPKAGKMQDIKTTEVQTERLLEQQNETNKKQLSFFLKAHQRHDVNLKKNMEFALNCLKKREQIDRMREEEHLKILKDRETRHLHKKLESEQKKKEELERLQKRQEELMESKKIQLTETENELREKAKEKILRTLKEIEHQQFLEKHRKEMVYIAFTEKKQIDRKNKILEQQEQERKEKERRLKEKIAKIEARMKFKEKSMLTTIETKKYKENEKLSLVRENYRSVQLKRNQKSEKLLETSRLSGQIRKAAESVSKMSTADKLRMVQDEAKKKLEEKRAYLNKKMAEFDERMRKKQEDEKMNADERKELAREWAETLKLNLEKKKRKDLYKREILEDKLKKLQEKQKTFEENQKLMKKERFYAKITNEMKAHYVKEALHGMALKKNWSLDKIETIMGIFQPTIQEAVHKDVKAINSNINKVLKDPFCSTSNSSIPNPLQEA